MSISLFARYRSRGSWILVLLACVSSLAATRPDAALAKRRPQAEPPAPTTERPKAPEASTTPASDSPESQALEPYNRGVELFQVAQIQAEKGNPQGQKALLKEAADAFRKAAALDPKQVNAQSNLGFVYLTLNDYKPAIRAFVDALAVNPNHLNSLNGLATAYALADRLPQSLQTFDRLTTLDPTNPQYFFNRGSVLQKAARAEEAQAAYLQALKLDPKDQRALFNLATLLENQGDYDGAVGYYQKAKAVDISNPVGLEAVHRIQAIDSLKKQIQSEQNAASAAKSREQDRERDENRQKDRKKEKRSHASDSADAQNALSAPTPQAALAE